MSSAGIGASASAAMPLTRCSAVFRVSGCWPSIMPTMRLFVSGPPVFAAVAGGPIDTTDRYPPEVSYPATWLRFHVQ